MGANYTFNNFRFDRPEKDDGPYEGVSSKNTTTFSMSSLLNLTPTISFQPQVDRDNTSQPATIMTPKLLNAINVVNSHAQAGPSAILDPNKSIVADQKNPQQLIDDSKKVMAAATIVRAAQNNGSSQQGQQPVAAATTVTLAPGVSSSFIGQGTFSPVKTSSFTPVYASSRSSTKADTSVYRASTTLAPDPQTVTASTAGLNTNDLSGRIKNVNNFFADSGVKGAVIGGGGDALKKVVKDASLTLASATQADRMAELKPSPDFVAKYSMNGGMSLPKPGQVA